MVQVLHVSWSWDLNSGLTNSWALFISLCFCFLPRALWEAPQQRRCLSCTRETHEEGRGQAWRTLPSKCLVQLLNGAMTGGENTGGQKVGIKL